MTTPKNEPGNVDPNNPDATPAPTPAPDPNNNQAINTAMEKARTEERSKLQSQITSLKAERDALKTELATVKENLKTLTEEKTNLDTQYQSLKSNLDSKGGVNIEKAIQEAAQAAREHATSGLQTRIQELENQLKAESDSRKKVELDNLRRRLIEEAGGSKALIPEMVRGNSEEELRDSIEQSKAVFNRTIATAAPTPSGPITDNHPAGGPGVPPTPENTRLPLPIVGADTVVVQQPITQGQRMPLSDFAKNRQALKRQAAARYPTSVI